MSQRDDILTIGTCAICGAREKLYKYKGEYYCLADYRIQKDRANAKKMERDRIRTQERFRKWTS